MSVGANLVGKVFHVGQYSTGTVTNPSADPVIYTETNASPGSQFGAGDITITSVTTNQGVTTITGTIQTSIGPQMATGTLVGNDVDDFLINGTVAGQSGYIFLTNKPVSANGAVQPTATFAALSPNATTTTTGAQPGVGNSASVASESQNIAYDPNANAAPCFAEGTAIRTIDGDVAVESLKVGDLVVNVDGQTRRIKWLGHREVRCSRHPRPHEVLPIRIAAHAFGPHRPARDLVVSPGHSICVDVLGETLIPAASLINGTTIAQLSVDSVVYWHVELDSHDVILAENLPTESYLEMGNRDFFKDSNVIALDARPDACIGTHADFCRPFVDSGLLLEMVRERLAVQAARLQADNARIAA